MFKENIMEGDILKELNKLFWTFFKIGLFTFGGGYAMLPLIQKEVVEKEKWATDEEVMNYFAMGQCTPGVIAVNLATFIGYKIKGLFGGILATFSVVTPSVVIITIIAKFLEQFENIKEVRYAFNGIRVAVCVLILNAVIKFWKSGVKDGVGVVIFAAVFVISLLFDISSAWVIVGAVVIGILASIWKEKTL